MQTVIDSGSYLDSGLYIDDSGLLNGLEAMSEMRELLDEIYGSLTESPNEA